MTKNKFMKAFLFVVRWFMLVMIGITIAVSMAYNILPLLALETGNMAGLTSEAGLLETFVFLVVPMCFFVLVLSVLYFLIMYAFLKLFRKLCGAVYEKFKTPAARKLTKG